MPRPISKHNRHQKLRALVCELQAHTDRLTYYEALVPSAPVKKARTTLRRIIKRVAKDIMTTVDRPIAEPKSRRAVKVAGKQFYF